MELQELLKKKRNIFNHLLYEFQMYLETYLRLWNHIHEQNHDDILKNIILESHAVHLRNLIEFFNRENNCITTDTIFTGNLDMSYDDSRYKARSSNKRKIHLEPDRKRSYHSIWISDTYNVSDNHGF